MTERFVLVTTAHRGVFAGYADALDGKNITLRNARCCLYWSADVGGFLGLAETGPSRACRIGAVAPTLHLRDITSVAVCSEQARRAWEDALPYRGGV